MSDEFWKFKLPEPGKQITYSIPLGWVPTLVKQGLMWVRVSPERDHQNVKITTVGTGHPFDERLISLGTWTDSPFVWHAVAEVVP